MDGCNIKKHKTMIKGGNKVDILEYAIKMELDGEKFYNEQAYANRNNSLHTVFLSIAHDEANHARIISKKKDGVNLPLNEKARASANNVFSDLAGFEIESDDPKQIDVYREALKREQESIELYEKLLSESDEDLELYRFLISQEKEHFKLLEEIIKMVNRPNEWVEAAEFGRREEY
jgi:rubrerythrin